MTSPREPRYGDLAEDAVLTHRTITPDQYRGAWTYLKASGNTDLADMLGIPTEART